MGPERQARDSRRISRSYTLNGTPVNGSAKDDLPEKGLAATISQCSM
jgi:hypothetical protein